MASMICTLKSLLECVTRAVTLAQPADILQFESQYFLELLEFGKAMPDIDHAELIFHFQEQWELDFLIHTWKEEGTTASSAPSLHPQDATTKTCPDVQEVPGQKVTAVTVSSIQERPGEKATSKSVSGVQERPGGKGTIGPGRPKESTMALLKRALKHDQKDTKTIPTASVKPTQPTRAAPDEDRDTARSTKRKATKDTITVQKTDGKETKKSQATKTMQKSVERTDRQASLTHLTSPFKHRQPSEAGPKKLKKKHGKGKKHSKSKKTTQFKKKPEIVKQATENKRNRVLWIERERVKPLFRAVKEEVPLPPGVYLPFDLTHIIHYRQWKKGPPTDPESLPVLSGLCSNACPEDVKPFGVNQPGPYVMYTTVDSNGYLKNASAGQLSQSAHFSLQLPYTVLGLGRSANFLDHLFVGIPRKPGETETRKHEWTAIIPNSQLIVIPFPHNTPRRWSAKLYLTPSNSVLLTAIALIGVCVFILVIIGILHWKEKKADDREKRQEAHRFHFDAM
ncbi:uncharacterized protein itfg1 isoform X2 [Gambusia affinis]|uniref:uncharacterized protein itfg1 isoform X2 n=1 Tax=Gambusia affinis TaxID=33528 RepID=UPI001CDCE0FF|nr:uncharacterized protein itfg1 isoform X2 [Gambusia affinis]